MNVQFKFSLRVNKYKGKVKFDEDIKRILTTVINFSHRFVTPNYKSELCTLPRTPTPFKSAMEKYGPLQPLVSSSRFSELYADVSLSW